MKSYRVETEYSTADVNLIGRSYAANDSLAVEMIDIEDESPYARITVCLPDETLSNKNCAFVDTNNCPWIEEFLETNKIAKPTGQYGFSGYCAYPEYEFDLSTLIMK